MLSSTNNSLPKQNSPNIVRKLVNHYPVAFFSTIGISVTIVGISAMTALLDPGEMQPPASQSLPSPTVFEEPEPEYNLPPLWLIGAMVTSGLVGLILVRQGWKHKALLIKPLKNLKFDLPKPKKKRRVARKKRPQANFNLPQLPASYTQQPNPEPQVTIVPPHQANLLDDKKQGLAEEMDLRKERSLISLMRTGELKKSPQVELTP
ncbi:MAG: hypothetical protein WBG70_13630 [Spirulinaceae cyanobacterium]